MQVANAVLQPIDVFFEGKAFEFLHVSRVEADSKVGKARQRPLQNGQIPQFRIVFLLAFGGVFQRDFDVVLARVLQHLGGKIEIGLGAVEIEIGRVYY